MVGRPMRAAAAVVAVAWLLVSCEALSVLQSSRCLRGSSRIPRPFSSGAASSRLRALRASSEITQIEVPAEPAASEETFYKLWPALPIAPYSRRKTVVREVAKGRMWLFEQKQGILYVQVPVRMTVIRLDSGGLFVYAPVAPTKEVLRTMRELESKYGEVKYIVLPTTAVEHKVFAGPFANAFPEASAWVVPDQWSFPVQLPLSFLGFGFRKFSSLPPSSSVGSGKETVPWAADGELDHVCLGPLLSKGAGGGFEEAAFYHRPSRTLLVTDAVVSIPNDPPPILQDDPRPLLFHAKDDAFDTVQDSAQARRKGWQRIALFGFFFQPAKLDVRTWPEAFAEAKKNPMKGLGWGGLYPFAWQDGWQASFEALRGNGRLQVAPILKELIFNRKPAEVLDWVDEICEWDFNKVVPAHLDAPVAASPRDFRKAFDFLIEDPAMKLPLFELFNAKAASPKPLDEDCEFLRETSDSLTKSGTTFPAMPPVKR